MPACPAVSGNPVGTADGGTPPKMQDEAVVIGEPPCGVKNGGRDRREYVRRIVPLGTLAGA